MSNYIYTCACCGTQWDRTSTGRYPTPKELAGMVCQPCREAPKRIAALEAEAQRWREAHDKIIDYAAEVEESAKESIAEAAAENAALREAIEYQQNDVTSAVEHAKWLVADHKEICARLRETQQKYKLGLGGERLDVLVCDEVDALREDKARLVEALERFERRAEEALRKGAR